MIVYRDLEQGSNEWFLLRHGKIGGTRSKQLLTNSDTLLIELIAETVEPFDEDSEDFISDEMLRGMELEPEARIQLEKYSGLNFNEVGWIQSEIDLIGISPDGITDCETIACEIKCPGAKKHIQTCLSDEIPLDNLDQCVHYFTVNPKLVKLLFMSYRPEFEIKPIFVKELTLDSEVNCGTKAKPKMITVRELVELKKQAVKKLETKKTETINKLKF